MRDFFQTDWSALGVCIEEAAPAKKRGPAKNTSKTYEAAGADFTRRHSDQTRARMSAAAAGQRTQKHIDAIRKAHTGKVVSDETRARMSASLKGKSNPNKGKPGRKWTDEQKAAHAIRQQLEHAAGLRRTTKGTRLSDDHRAKLSQAAQNRSGPGNGAKRIHTPFGEFDSAKIAAEKLNIAYCSIARRMKKHPDQYYYITKDTK
jgi:hypothetical protein